MSKKNGTETNITTEESRSSRSEHRPAPIDDGFEIKAFSLITNTVIKKADDILTGRPKPKEEKG